MTDYSELQKRCQRGATNLNDANNLLAECYGVLGKLGVWNEQLMAQVQSMIDQTTPLVPVQSDPRWSRRITIDELRTALAECTASLESEVLQKFHGQKPEEMHPVTRREYDRDMAEINGYKALSKED